MNAISFKAVRERYFHLISICMNAKIFVCAKSSKNFSAVCDAVISLEGSVYDFLAKKLKLKHFSQVGASFSIRLTPVCSCFLLPLLFLASSCKFCNVCLAVTYLLLRLALCLLRYCVLLVEFMRLFQHFKGRLKWAWHLQALLSMA